MPDSAGVAALVLCVVLVILSIFFVVLRCIARFGMIKNPGPDDYLIIIATVLNVAGIPALILMGQNGNGAHVYTLSKEQFAYFTLVLFPHVIIYNIADGIAKLSVLVQYLRFMQDGYRRACLVIIGIVLLYNFAMSIAVVSSCHPLSAFWKLTASSQCRRNLDVIFYIYYAAHIVANIIICTLPLPVIATLKIPRARKILLGFLFAVGGIGTVASAIRLAYFTRSVRDGDITYHSSAVSITSSIEINIAIVCACLPTLTPIFKNFKFSMPKLNFIKKPACRFRASSAQQPCIWTSDFSGQETLTGDRRSSIFRIKDAWVQSMERSAKTKYSWSVSGGEVPDDKV